MTIHTRDFHPYSRYSLCILTAIEHSGHIMTMAFNRVPAVGQAGLDLMNACQTGNWFTTEKAARRALDELEQAGMMNIASTLRRALREGNQRIAAPYYAEQERAA